MLQHVAAQYIISQPLFAVEFTQLTEFEHEAAVEVFQQAERQGDSAWSMNRRG